MSRVINGDALTELRKLPDESVDMCVTSPPYFGLRDYGVGGQIGLEETPDTYIQALTKVFHEVRRVLKPQGTLWLNIGDSYCNSNGYARASEQFQREGRNDAPANDRDLTQLHNAGYKTKDLIGIPWMLAFALRNDGWYLRQDIIWQKPNPMPESVTDRCTKSHEYIFLFSKSSKYYFDHEAIQEDAIGEPCVRDKHAEGYQADYAHGDRFSPGERVYGANGKRNKRDVWNVSVAPIKEAHFATFPKKLIEPCILAGCPVGGTVLDPFFGSGTTGVVATELNRDYIGIELNPKYVEIINKRTSNIQLSLTGMVEGL